MRVLVTTIPAYGHLMPVLRLARALIEAGHDVAVATAAGFGEVVAEAGLKHIPAGVGLAEASVQAFERHPEYGGMSERERGNRVVADVMVGVHAAALVACAADLIAWRPDVILREEGEFAAPVLAELIGVPCAEHGWGPMRPPEQLRAVADALAPIYESVGLHAPLDGGIHRWLYLDPCPDGLAPPHARDLAVRHPIRPAAGDFGGVDAPAWLSATTRPLVYITLGTVPAFNSDTDLLLTAIAACAADAEIAVDVGPGSDPAALGPQPANVHVAQLVAQGPVLGRCAVVVSNGSSGTMMGALAAGAPLLIVPNNAPSQARNAQAVRAVGAGRVLARAEVTTERVRSELLTLMSPGAHRTSAERLAAEIAGMPTPKAAVGLIEELVRTGTPIPARRHRGAFAAGSS